MTMTFSWRDQESSVQFVDPVQTASPSRTTNLWCMRSGIPGNPARLDRQRLDRLGGRLRRRRDGDRPGMGDVVDQPDGDAALNRGEQRCENEGAGVRLEAHVVEREVEDRCALARKPAIPRATSDGRWPPSVRVSISIAEPATGCVTRSGPGARLCGRALQPGTRRGLRASRLRRGRGDSGRAPVRPAPRSAARAPIRDP